MERINYAINDNLKYTDFNNYLQDMSVKSISLIDLLNKQLKLNTIGNINNIDVNSSNKFVQNFLNYSFIDFVSKFYLYPKSTPNVDNTDLLAQNLVFKADNDSGITKLQLYYWEYYSAYDKASYKTPSDRKIVDKELYRYNSTEFYVNSNNNNAFYHKFINNNTSQIGLPESISGWDKEIKIPICEAVIRGHVKNAQSVIIKTPHPRRNIVFDGSPNSLKTTKIFNVPNLNEVDIVFYLSNYENASFHYERKDLERQYAVQIEIYNVLFYLAYFSGTLSVTYSDNWYSGDNYSGAAEPPENTRAVITVSVAS